MNVWVKELGCIALAAVACAVIVPRVLMPPLAEAQRPPAHLRRAVAVPSPAPDAPTTDAPVTELAHDDSDAITPASLAHLPPRARRDRLRALPAGLRFEDGRWIADLRQLPPPREALAGLSIAPPGEGPQPEGFLVTQCDRAGFLRLAGVRPGDVLIGVSGMPLRNPDDALDAVARLHHADRATFEFLRNGARYRVPVELVNRPAGMALGL